MKFTEHNSSVDFFIIELPVLHNRLVGTSKFNCNKLSYIAVEMEISLWLTVVELCLTAETVFMKPRTYVNSQKQCHQYLQRKEMDILWSKIRVLSYEVILSFLGVSLWFEGPSWPERKHQFTVLYFLVSGGYPFSLYYCKYWFMIPSATNLKNT